jgi:ParB/Sulfiredoxin domain
MERKDLTVVWQAISSIRPNPCNARTHSKHQIKQIAESIKQFGFTNPVLTDSGNQIIAGHGRYEAAKLLGLIEVPTARLDWLTKEQIKAYVIADNKLAENAGWDPEILAIELQELLQLEGADFDVTITGFEVPEIDGIIEGAKGQAEHEDPVPDPDFDSPPVTTSGDIWNLGKHKICCGDSLQGETYQLLMGSRRAAAVFADPPYNVKIDGHATGNGSIHHREFAMASGEMSEREYYHFLMSTIQLTARFSKPNAVNFCCMDWRHIEDLIRAGRLSYGELICLCVWVKDNGGWDGASRLRPERPETRDQRGGGRKRSRHLHRVFKAR